MAWLKRLLPPLQGVSQTYRGGVIAPVKRVSITLRKAPASEHVSRFISDMQESGHTGVQPRGEVLNRYYETCIGADIEPIGLNAFCEALAAICEKRRPLVNGHRITAYVIPSVTKKRGGLRVIPNGNSGDDIPYDLPERARSGTAHHA